MYRQEKVGDVMRDINRNAHIREVKPVAQSDQRERDEVMGNKLIIVLPGLLQTQNQDNSLLRPVRGLQKVIRLEHSIMRLVRKALVHGRGVEVPDWRPRHDVQTKRPEQDEVKSGIKLLHETGLLGTGLDAVRNSNGLDYPLHDELARKGENDYIEADKGDIQTTLAILN